jgi:hypothetical protein
MKRLLQTAAGIMAFIIVAVALLAAAQAIMQRPSVILDEPSCAPPCWRGITPGVTTPDEAFSILVRMDGVEFMTLTERMSGEEVRQLTWLFTSPAPDSTGRIYYQDGEVAAILIGTYGSVRLREMIDLLGEPTSLWTHCFRQVEGSRAQSVVLWPDQGYAVVVDHHAVLCPVPEGVQPAEDDRVSHVAYFQPPLLPMLLEVRLLFGPDSEAALSEAMAWSPIDAP